MSHTTSNDTVRGTVVNHVSVPFSCDAAAIWREIIDGLAKAGSFTSIGYVKDDCVAQNAYPRGYRLLLENEHGRSEQHVQVTEQDDEAMCLSVRAQVRGLNSGNLISYASYRAVAGNPEGRIEMDCHSTIDLNVGESASPAKIAEAAAVVRDQFNLIMENGLKAMALRAARPPA